MAVPPSWVPAERFTSNQDDSRSQVYQELLQTSPVAHLEVPGLPGGYWTVFGHDDIVTVTSNPAVFSNGTGRPGPKVVPLQVDPPDHAAYRKMLNPFLSPSRIAKLEPALRASAAAMLDDMVAAGEADLAADYAYPYPARSLCRLLGAPDADWPFHYDFLMEMDERTQDGLLITARAYEALPARIMPYLYNLVRDRRTTPGEDLLSRIIASSVNGRALEDHEVAGLALTFMLAGWITTASATSNLFARIAADSTLQTRLRSRPDDIPKAIEECLRIDSPVQVMPRNCAEQTEIGGQRLQAGDHVLVSYGSGNLDPAVWSEPQVFDIDRPDQRHLAFGRGIHQCIGSTLARTELRVSVEELLRRTSTVELSGQVVRRSWPRTAVDHLPVTLRPAG